MKSTSYRSLVSRTLGASRKKFFFPEVPDSDEDDILKEENKEAHVDVFLDVDFDCETEVIRSKKTAMQQKISQI